MDVFCLWLMGALGVGGWAAFAIQTIRCEELDVRLEFLEEEHRLVEQRAHAAEATVRSWVQYNTRKDFG